MTIWWVVVCSILGFANVVFTFWIAYRADSLRRLANNLTHGDLGLSLEKVDQIIWVYLRVIVNLQNEIKQKNRTVFMTSYRWVRY